MSTTLKQALDALSDIGLTDVVVGEEDDGNILLILNRKLDSDDSTLVEFPDEFDDDPE